MQVEFEWGCRRCYWEILRGSRLHTVNLRSIILLNEMAIPHAERPLGRGYEIPYALISRMRLAIFEFK